MLLSRIDSGDFDAVILSPPCGTWSRAPWSNNAGPGPVRSRHHPWGCPSQRSKADRRRLLEGNEFIHFSLRAIAGAQSAKRRGRKVAVLLEHPRRSRPSSCRPAGQHLATTRASAFLCRIFILHSRGPPVPVRGRLQETRATSFGHYVHIRVRIHRLAALQLSGCVPRTSAAQLRAQPQEQAHRLAGLRRARHGADGSVPAQNVRLLG